MCYLGIGIGHRSTNNFEPTAANEVPMQVDHDENSDAGDTNPDLAFENREPEDEVNDSDLDEEDDYGYNHNQLIMAEEELEEEEEEHEWDEWESMYVDE